MKPPSQRNRNFMWTLNNYTDEEVALLQAVDCKYMTWGYEVRQVCYTFNVITFFPYRQGNRVLLICKVQLYSVVLKPLSKLLVFYLSVYLIFKLYVIYLKKLSIVIKMVIFMRMVQPLFHQKIVDRKRKNVGKLLVLLLRRTVQMKLMPIYI